MLTRKRVRVELVGADALTIVEARSLIRAALAGRHTVMPGDVKNVESAVEKVAEGLIGAGQDREMVQAMMEHGY